MHIATARDSPKTTLKSRHARRDEPSFIVVGGEVLVALVLDGEVVVSGGFPSIPPFTADGVVAAPAVDAADLNASSVSEPLDLRRTISNVVWVSTRDQLTVGL